MAVAVGTAGEVLDHEDRVTPGRTTEASVVEDVIVEAVTALTRRSYAATVGIGAAGFIDHEQQRVMFAPHLSWRAEPLAKRLAERLAMPVLVDNDANAALWAEHRFGAAMDVQDAVMITLGTGIGGALLAGGQLYRGHNGMAGEFGHMQVLPGGRPCECGRTGCWEQYCSGKALARFARGAGSELAGPALTQAAREGDPVASGAFTEVGRWLGVGVSNIVAAFDPALVVVGGGVSAAGGLLLDPARTVLHETLVGKGFRKMPALVAAELGPLAGAIGAADLARRAFAE